jgi:hypothetical protein
MLGAFRNPRVEGRFAGESLSAFDTLWGNGDGHVVFENRYINVTGGRVRFGDSEITAEGRFLDRLSARRRRRGARCAFPRRPPRCGQPAPRVRHR